jgi:hypothetical protein
VNRYNIEYVLDLVDTAYFSMFSIGKGAENDFLSCPNNDLVIEYISQLPTVYTSY